MEEGLFKQTSDPIPFTGSDGTTWYYIDFIEFPSGWCYHQPIK